MRGLAQTLRSKEIKGKGFYIPGLTEGSVQSAGLMLTHLETLIDQLRRYEIATSAKDQSELVKYMRRNLRQMSPHHGFRDFAIADIQREIPGFTPEEPEAERPKGPGSSKRASSN
jgi:hypothetical protein